MTPYPLIPPKVAHTKNKGFGVYSKQLCEILEYRIFIQQASKSVRRHNVVKYCWSVHALLNRITRCETSNSKKIYYCVPWYINIWQFFNLITIPKLIRSTFLRFLASNSAPPVCTTPYPLLCTWARCSLCNIVFTTCIYVMLYLHRGLGLFPLSQNVVISIPT